MPGKAKKDPNKPKGRMSSYAFYVQKERSDCKSNGVEVEFTAFSKKCALNWKDMDADDKADFTELAQKDKERFDSEMAAYVPSEGYDDKGKLGGNGKKKRTKKEKDPNMPKRAMSAFFWFGADKRPKLKAQNPGATVGEIAKQLGAAWKLMTPAQKAPYEKSAKGDRERYDVAISDYRNNKFEPKEEEEEEEEEYDDEEEED